MTSELITSEKISLESFSSVIEEIKPILVEHWEEIALYNDIPLDPEYDLYESLDKKGLLAIYTVRSVGKLVGYAVYFVRRHHHYRNHTWAISDIILIRKAFRNFGLGNRLFDFIENDLRNKGVDVMHTMTKAAHPELAFLLKSRNHEKSEVSFSKRL